MRKLLKKIKLRHQAVAFAIVAAIMAIMPAAFAVDDPAAVAVEGGLDHLETVLTQVAVYALPVAAGLFAILLGWKWAKKFVR